MNLRTEDLAKGRMADRMREAEAYRLGRQARGTRGARSEARSGHARRVGAWLVAPVLWPIKH